MLEIVLNARVHGKRTQGLGGGRLCAEIIEKVGIWGYKTAGERGEARRSKGSLTGGGSPRLDESVADREKTGIKLVERL